MSRRDHEHTSSIPDEAHDIGHRHERLQQLLAEELAGLLRDELTNPLLEGVRLSAVQLSVDYRSARVAFYTLALVEESRAAVAKLERALERATPFLRERLGDAVDLKRMPELHFAYDRGAAAEARAGRLLDAEKEPVSVPPSDDGDEGDGGATR
jgi:ribosome-binding factor A